MEYKVKAKKPPSLSPGRERMKKLNYPTDDTLTFHQWAWIAKQENMSDTIYSALSINLHLQQGTVVLVYKTIPNLLYKQ